MTIKSISAYRSAYDLLIYETDFLQDRENDDFLHFLHHCDDFESIEYFCLNGEMVCVSVSCNGDVLHIDTMEQFLQSLKDYYAEMG